MARPIEKIIIHCSATPNGRPNTAADIDSWHEERGFRRDDRSRASFNQWLKSIGYHYVIRVDGTVETGREESEVGAHCIGHNTRSIGVCLIGTDRFTRAQWRALADKVSGLEIKYPSATLHGHREFAAKECPGFDVRDWIKGNCTPLSGHIMEDSQ